jgi:N-acetylglucosaminyldiphosphoundecaprenol N-acetyl-beta-D-mannosaminyltransferase
MKRKTIFNSSISIGTYPAFVDEIFSLIRYKIPSYVCFANVHMLIEAHQDRVFQKVINQANLVAPDGKPLSLFLRLSEGIRQDRICGMDILPDLLKRAEASGKSVYFYGTTEELLQVIIQKARKEFPALNISGYYSPPFRNLSSEETFAILHTIKEAAPDLVFVSLGCPKQEKWMAEHKDKIGACLLGLGQAFKVYAGQEKRLPTWMRDLSLEWLYRLYLEPGRLWKRYAFTNSYFLVLVIQSLAQRFFRQLFSPHHKARLSDSSIEHPDK